MCALPGYMRQSTACNAAGHTMNTRTVAGEECSLLVLASDRLRAHRHNAHRLGPLERTGRRCRDACGACLRARTHAHTNKNTSTFAAPTSPRHHAKATAPQKVTEPAGKSAGTGSTWGRRCLSASPQPHHGAQLAWDEKGASPHQSQRAYANQFVCFDNAGENPTHRLDTR